MLTEMFTACFPAVFSLFLCVLLRQTWPLVQIGRVVNVSGRVDSRTRQMLTGLTTPA